MTETARQRGTPPEGPPAKAAMHAVADTLRGYGFDVRFPKCSDGRRLTIVNAKDARSEITVQDSGFITWDYWPWTGSETDPADIVGLILGILGPSMTRERPTINHALTLKGAVGLALRKLGLNVALVVCEDDETLNVTGEIVVTNPTYPCSGSVRVTDDGC